MQIMKNCCVLVSVGCGASSCSSIGVLSWVLWLMKRLVILLVFLALTDASARKKEQVLEKYGGGGDGECLYKRGGLIPRPHSVSILEFGAVGDGKTLNTIAFQNAIFYLKSFADKGGAQLFVPAGKWLTGSFNLTSHLTLYFDRGAIILGSQEALHWPVVEPLPSYGRGSELPGGRHSSLINGHNLTDVVITGDNGTIDGQGSIWWDWFNSHSLNYSRPHLVEIISSSNVVISNLTFLNSPAWSIHPVYSSNVQVHNITVHAPANSPFTVGIVPDSSSNICIEDCHVSVGHDAIVLKSGWDEYGIAYGTPTSNVFIRSLFLQSSRGSALAFGSEMSGGISDVQVENLRIYNSYTGIKLKTIRGRGGFIKDITISEVEMDSVQVVLGVTGQCGKHPDDRYNPDLLPIIDQITVKNVIGTNISIAGDLVGISQSPFTGICLSNISLSITSDFPSSWFCSSVMGFSESVFPQPCSDLQTQYSNSSSACFSLSDSTGFTESS